MIIIIKTNKKHISTMRWFSVFESVYSGRHWTFFFLSSEPDWRGCECNVSCVCHCTKCECYKCCVWTILSLGHCKSDVSIASGWRHFVLGSAPLIPRRGIASTSQLNSFHGNSWLAYADWCAVVYSPSGEYPFPWEKLCYLQYTGTRDSTIDLQGMDV